MPTSITTDDQLDGITCFSLLDKLIRNSLRRRMYNLEESEENERPHSEHSSVPPEASLNIVSYSCMGCMSRSTEWFDWQHV